MQWISQKSSWPFRPRLGNRLEAFTKLKFLNGGEKRWRRNALSNSEQGDPMILP
jgi:hypothetical protein